MTRSMCCTGGPEIGVRANHATTALDSQLLLCKSRHEDVGTRAIGYVFARFTQRGFAVFRQ